MGLELALLSNNEFILKTSIFSCFGGGEIREYAGSYFKDQTAETRTAENIPESEYEGKHWLITINKGKIDGVNKSLIFRTQNSEFFIEPDSIFEDKTVGKSYLYKFNTKDYPAGTVLKTKWED